MDVNSALARSRLPMAPVPQYNARPEPDRKRMLPPAIASIPVHRSAGADAATVVAQLGEQARQYSGLLLRVSVKGRQLGGRIYCYRGKRQLNDGTQIMTTEVVESAEQRGLLTVMTQSGSRYIVGSWSSEMARDAFLQLEAGLIEKQAELVVQRIAARQKFLKKNSSR